GRAPACLVLYADAFGPAAEQLTPRPNVETLGCAWLLTRQGQGPVLKDLPAAGTNAEFVRAMEKVL
ncbi:MAG: hypothetical protein IT462_05475, partial [Planctomycetes bacterium]|nr:hypothetical protein [Planctomycetota bacterium]